MVQALWETVQQFHKELSIHVLYDPATIPLGMYIREMKVYVNMKTCT